jgi:hypothetical protein
MLLSFSDRNALARVAAVPPLAPDALIYTPGPPQFADLTASTLGNAGTPSDGFDSLFSSVAGIVDGDIAALAALDTLLAGVAFVPGTLDAVMFAPIAKDYAAFIKAGDGQLGGGGGGGGTKPPPPKKGPPPPQDPLCKRRFPDIGAHFDPSIPDPCTPDNL